MTGIFGMAYFFNRNNPPIVSAINTPNSFCGKEFVRVKFVTKTVKYIQLAIPIKLYALLYTLCYRVLIQWGHMPIGQIKHTEYTESKRMRKRSRV